jgi:hypothetical protein
MTHSNISNHIISNFPKHNLVLPPSEKMFMNICWKVMINGDVLVGVEFGSWIPSLQGSCYLIDWKRVG